MSEENKESRINIEDLPQAEQKLTAEEAKDVKGGDAAFTGGVFVGLGDVNGDSVITGTDAIRGPHVKK